MPRTAKQAWLLLRPGLASAALALLATFLIVERVRLAGWMKRSVRLAENQYQEARKIYWAVQFSRKMDKVYDAQPDSQVDVERVAKGTKFVECWGITTNAARICDQILEIVPYFYYEGVVPRQHTNYPKAVIYMPLTEMEHFHLGGRAYIYKDYLILNHRYVNPEAPWYREVGQMATLVHELGHLQGIHPKGWTVSQGEMAWVESSNQIVAVEVLAAMVNSGNKRAVKPLAGELRGFAMSYLMLQAHERNADWAYHTYSHLFISTEHEERARHAKAMRYWKGTEEREKTLWRIVEAYQAEPYNYVYDAWGEHGLVTELHLRAKNEYLTIDDVRYFVRHRDNYLPNKPPIALAVGMFAFASAGIYAIIRW